MRNVAWPAVGFLLAIFVATAQEPIRVDVHLINVAFSVLDAEGKFVTDLNQDDFEVTEDNAPQKISFFGRASEIPLHLGLVADFSGSQSNSIKPHHKDLQTFLKTVVTARDDAFLVCFANRVRLAQDFTANSKEIVESLDLYEKMFRGKTQVERGRFPDVGPREIRPGTTDTAFFDAVYNSIETKLTKGEERGRKAIVIFSDGDDNSSSRDEYEAIEIAQRADTVLFCVRYTELRKDGRITARNKNGTTVLDRMARETGGAAFDARERELAAHFRAIGDQLRSSYELAYHTTNPVSDGSFHKIQIKAKRPGLTVRAKSGYIAK
ncbi:MAG TPA: VWA domain-containing protein [Verrucomicrobiae bacterium]|nr:VWA domain-containing protein [Verrucomicrobiae bacterium]